MNITEIFGWIIYCTTGTHTSIPVYGSLRPQPCAVWSSAMLLPTVVSTRILRWIIGCLLHSLPMPFQLFQFVSVVFWVIRQPFQGLFPRCNRQIGMIDGDTINAELPCLLPSNFHFVFVVLHYEILPTNIGIVFSQFLLFLDKQNDIPLGIVRSFPEKLHR
jgi:hypothetical protein